MKYVVVDIETTGGKPNGNAITEIGVVHVEHGKIVHQWSTLVKPDRSIPLSIQTLTGITNEMVEEAKSFEQIANELLVQLVGDVFVAHSVNFDYSFIEAAFKSIGQHWRMDKLCTVKYAKTMFPELGKYSLAHLSKSLEVVNDNPHRALSDALCAAEILIHCLTADYNEQKLHDPKIGLLRRIQLPDLLAPEKFDLLPKDSGVYQFLDHCGTPLYIGKAKNIKSRITQHFSTDQGSTKFHRLMKECTDITYQTFPNDTLSLIYEDHLIRKHWPPLNKAQKNQQLKFGVYAYENGRGEDKLVAQKIVGHGALRKFGSYVSAVQWIAEFQKAIHEKQITLKEAITQLKEENQRCILFKLHPHQGALFIEKGSITGIYNDDDYLFNVDWIRENFIAVQPSPTINSIGQKMIEQRQDNVIEI